LGIHGVGEFVARLLANNFVSLKELEKMSEDKLMEIDGIGPKVAHSVIDFFSRQQNLETLDRMFRAGVEIIYPPKTTSEHEVFLINKTFVFTGTLQKFSRDEARDLVIQFGGKASGSVSSKTNFVVLGTDPGLKQKKAIELGVKILTEDEFDQLIKNRRLPD